MKTVITNGVFDVIHPGHFSLLMFCRNLAGPDGELIILVDDDVKVREDKGVDRPIFKSYERLKQLMSIEIDGYPIISETEVFYNNEHLNSLIYKYKADILVKGSDWEGKRVIGAEHVKEVKFFKHSGISSSEIIDRIKQGPKWKSLNRK